MATHVIDGGFLPGTAVYVIARSHANHQAWAWERPVRRGRFIEYEHRGPQPGEPVTMAPTDSDSHTVITLPDPAGPPDRYWAVGSPGAMVWGSARWGSARWGNDPAYPWKRVAFVVPSSGA